LHLERFRTVLSKMRINDFFNSLVLGELRKLVLVGSYKTENI